jgi:hypothetical protein
VTCAWSSEATFLVSAWLQNLVDTDGVLLLLRRYVSATAASRHLMQIMQHRMATEDVWDQSAYNMELWQPSRDAHFTGGCTIRVMSPLCFVNSKVGCVAALVATEIRQRCVCGSVCRQTLTGEPTATCDAR